MRLWRWGNLADMNSAYDYEKEFTHYEFDCDLHDGKLQVLNRETLEMQLKMHKVGKFRAPEFHGGFLGHELCPYHGTIYHEIGLSVSYRHDNLTTPPKRASPFA